MSTMLIRSKGHLLSYGTSVIVKTVFVLALVATPVLGQTRAKTDLVPQGASVAMVLFPKTVADDPELDLFPREVVTAWGLKEIGLDPMRVKQATFVVETPNSLQAPPAWSAVLRLDEEQGLTGSRIDELDEKTMGGKKVFSGTNLGLPSYLIIDESTIVIGDERYFGDILESNKKGPLVDLIKGSSVEGQMQMFMDMKALRPVLSDTLAMAPPMPPQLARLKTIPNFVDAIEVGTLIEGFNAETTIVLHTKDSEDADKVGKIFSEGITFGKDFGISLLEAQMNADNDVQFATIDYIERMADMLVGQMKPRVSGNKVTITLSEEATLAPLLLGMGLPAVQQVRTAARRTQSMNNVRQMSLASLNYESAYGKFPRQATKDAKGKSLLSWRVQILPFMEQQELYDQFHHDEPWDSPHNKKLIKKMPELFASPSVAIEPGMTVYLAISGEGTMFDDKDIGFGNITDGSSNTALFVEANPEMAVPWTKPQDYEFDEKDPMKGVGGVTPGGFIVTLADGSTHFISNNVDPKIWRQLQTIADGNVINFGDF